MDPLQAQEIYNFSELTPEAQRILFLRGLGFDEAAQQLASATGKDIGTVRHELIQSATERCQRFSNLEIACYWMMMKFELTRQKREGSIV
jgi:hypothetical protein